MDKIVTVNPYTEKKIAEYKTHSLKQAMQKAELAKKAFERWKETKIKERAKIVSNIVRVLLRNRIDLAQLITTETGKTITESVSEIDRYSQVADYYAKNGKAFLEDEIVKLEEYKRSYISFEPYGTFLAIEPWNYPFGQVLRIAIPALMAGNTVLLKHSAAVTGCALEIERVFQKAGVPEGVFQTLVVGHEVTEKVIPNVDGVAFTGSAEAGEWVAGVAGSYLKKTILELGGSDPHIVLDNANIPMACHGAVKGRMSTCGQRCVGAKRFIVHKTVLDEFTKEFVRLVQELIIGDPMDKETEIGPLVSREQRDKLHMQVKKSVKMGAKPLVGGMVPDMKGFFYSPTILANVTPDMPVFKEETFGPVAPITSAQSEEEAIGLANHTEFGLGASIWSRDVSRAETLAKKLQTGMVAINRPVGSHPSLPFGGTKRSGIGRELGKYGMLELVNIKTITI